MADKQDGFLQQVVSLVSGETKEEKSERQSDAQERQNVRDDNNYGNGGEQRQQSHRKCVTFLYEPMENTDLLEELDYSPLEEKEGCSIYNGVDYC